MDWRGGAPPDRAPRRVPGVVRCAASTHRPAAPRTLARRRSAARRRQLARRRGVALAVALVVLVLIVWRAAACACGGSGGAQQAVTYGPVPPAPIPSLTGDGVKVGTFLGNYSRRFYGLGPGAAAARPALEGQAGHRLDERQGGHRPAQQVVGQRLDGHARTSSSTRARPTCSSAATTTACAASTPRPARWCGSTSTTTSSRAARRCSGTPSPTGEDDTYIVCAGSRRGYPLAIDDPNVAPYRAVTFGSGKELWRLPVVKTASYSRDTDGSGFFLDGRQYVGVERRLVLRPRPAADRGLERLQEAGRGGEAPAARGRARRVARRQPGAGVVAVGARQPHLHRLRRRPRVRHAPRRPGREWDYFIGSDLDGTVVPTRRNKLLVPVEKQYIKGHGGVLCLDPSKPPEKATEWFFPTGERKVGEWRGGLDRLVRRQRRVQPRREPAGAGGVQRHRRLHAPRLAGPHEHADGEGSQPGARACRRRWRWPSSGTPAPSPRRCCSTTP